MGVRVGAVVWGWCRAGLEVVREAQRCGVHVRAGVRNVQRATARGLLHEPPASIRVVPLDVVSSPDSTLQAALEGVQVVICCVGFVPTYSSAAYDRAQMWAVDAEGVGRLVRAAEAAGGVRRFVLVSSLLVNAPATASYTLLNTLGGVLEAKAAAEQRLRDSSLAYTILRPGVFALRPQGGMYLAAEDTFDGEMHDPVLGPPVACASPFMAGSDRAVCGVTRTQVGGAAVMLTTCCLYIHLPFVFLQCRNRELDIVPFTLTQILCPRAH